jgi:T5SS/PEP-CTERM-associated repeat protein
MGITYTWQSGATNFGLASSWTPSGGPPTSSDDAEIDVAANVSGTGVAQELDINAAVTVSSLLNTTVVNAAIIGNSAVGGVTVSSTWDADGYLQLGGADAGTLTIGSGGVVDQSVTDGNLDVGQNAGALGTLTVQGGGVLDTQADYFTLGANAGSSGIATITGAGSSVTIAGLLNVGLEGDGQVTVSDGGDLTTSGTIGDGFYDGIGYNAGSEGSVTVTGANSTWKSANDIQVGGEPLYGGGGTGALTAEDGGFVQSAQGLSVYADGTITVDSTSVIESGTAGGAKVGYLTLDPGTTNTGLYGDGTVDANVIDNSNISAIDGGPMTINGSVSGDGNIGIGGQGDLVLNGSVTLPGGVNFYGWYGTLALGDPGQFDAGIYNFMPGDVIDLTNTPYDPSDSSYSYNAGQLTITEGVHTYTLNNVYSSVPLSGVLTLKKDASGAGTDVVFTSVPASPFNLWSTLPDFFSTSSGPVNGDDWATSNVTGGGEPIWVETETPASAYALGSPGDYTIVITSQDWLGTEQPLVAVATDTNIVDPFGSGPNQIGNLGAAAIFSSNGTTGNGAVLYWANSSTAGDYAVEFQPITTTYVTAPSVGPNTVLSGSPVTLLSAVADPTSWTFSNSTPTSFVFAYTTAASSTTENLWFQAFTNEGVATTAGVEVAANIPDSTQYYISYGGGSYGYRYTVVNGSATGLYGGTFNDATGALGAASEILSLPSFTSFSGVVSRPSLSSGDSLRFLEGVEDGQAVIQAFVNSNASPTVTFNLASANDPFATTDVYDPNDGQLDYTVVVYTDNNQVHLELLNENGTQIGSDFVVPGLTSFDRIHTLTGSTYNADTRVEIDYTVADPSGGTEVEGLIYDTAAVPDYYTLGGGGDNEYVGTPFNDFITDAPGIYTVNGGGGDDTFVVNDPASEAQLSENSAGDVIVTIPGGVTTLQRFSTIQFDDATVTINGDQLTQNNFDGSRVVSTFNITGQAYTSDVLSYGADGQLHSELYAGVTEDGNLTSFEYLFGGNNLIGTDEFYTGITGQPYTGEEIDYNGAGGVTRDVFTGVTGEPFSSYEYNFVGGVYAGAEYTFTNVPDGASYSSYVVDESPTNAFSGEQFYFTNITGQSYTGEEEDFNSNVQLSQVVLTGVIGEPYSSLQLDYSAGTYEGYQAYYNITGQSYTNEEVDVSASGQLEKVVYSGMTSTPYSSVEQDYSGGALSDVIYGFTDVTGASFNAYQVEDNASGTGLQETLDLNNGGHTLYALVAGQTLTSQGDDTMVGSDAGATTFVFDAIYGHDTIANFTTADTISLPSSEFANFAAMDTTSHVANVAGNVVITASDGDTLTIDGLSTTTLAGLSANFKFPS